jgi:hypothetical protein
MKINCLLLAFSFLLMTSSPVLSQNAVCAVRSYFVDVNTRISTSWSLIGKFSLQQDKEDAFQYFRDEVSGVNVSVAVKKYKSPFKKAPTRIMMRISFTGKPADDFESLEGAQAEAIFDKNWKILSVSDDIWIGYKIYTFSFGCEKRKDSR